MIAADLIECSGCLTPHPRESLNRAGRCDVCGGIQGNLAIANGAVVSPFLPWSRDPAARFFVETYPDGATLQMIGDAFGMTRERVRMIESVALERLRKRAALAGITPEDLAAVLAQRARASTYEGDTHPSPPAEAELDVDERPQSPEGLALDAALDRYVAAADRLAPFIDEMPDVDRRPPPAPEVSPMPAPIMLTHDGITDSINGWEKRLGYRIRGRLKTMSVAEALTAPKEPGKRLGTPYTPRAARGDATSLAAAQPSPPVTAPAREPVPPSVTALDGVAILVACGAPHEVIGRVPRGRLVLVLDGESRA